MKVPNENVLIVLPERNAVFSRVSSSWVTSDQSSPDFCVNLKPQASRAELCCRGAAGPVLCLAVGMRPGRASTGVGLRAGTGTRGCAVLVSSELCRKACSLDAICTAQIDMPLRICQQLSRMCF